MVENEIFVPNWPVAQKKYELLMLQELLKYQKAERILEVGTWTGGTALLWAKMVSKYDNGIVYCCDLNFFYGSHWAIEPGYCVPREYNVQAYANGPYAKYVKELPGNTHDRNYIEYVRQIVGTPVDFMFIDGDHSYEGVKADYYNFKDFVRPGGYIAFHDVLDTSDHISRGCRVAEFWRELRAETPEDKYWEFIDNNEYPGMPSLIPSKCMGIGVIKTPN